ncbi:hypothetical protein C8J57DRAFT_1505341 [Mycena rebaudengoi]|nr:hypothetical protein C8J57DRAFT_1505341 [Mycena rebaudengoi]
MPPIGTAAILPPLPPQATTVLARMTWGTLDRVREIIQLTIPPFLRAQSAFLYSDGNHVHDRVWVRMPVIRGIRFATNAAEMEMARFLDCYRGGNGPVIDLDRTSITIDHFPFDEPTDLPNSYTIVVSPQRSSGPDIYPVNGFITHLVPGRVEPWRGNILVFKHGLTKTKCIISMSEGDAALVQCILTRVVQEGLNHNENAVELLRRRIRRYTPPFFPDELSWMRFFHTLESTLSWIDGSVPTAALSLACNPDVPDNMNVLTTSKMEEIWGRLMLLGLGFQLEFSVRVSSLWELVGERYMSFTHPAIPNKSITFTTSSGPDICLLFLAGRHTAQLNAITPYEVVTFYVHMTAEQRAMSMLPTTRILTPNPFPEDLRLSRTTEDWKAACGTAYPALWHSTKGLRGVGCWSWNGVDNWGSAHMDPVLQEMGDANIIWHTGWLCKNRYCPYGKLAPSEVADQGTLE